jgi:hypothetical protein
MSGCSSLRSLRTLRLKSKFIIILQALPDENGVWLPIAAVCPHSSWSAQRLHSG